MIKRSLIPISILLILVVSLAILIYRGLEVEPAQGNITLLSGRDAASPPSSSYSRVLGPQKLSFPSDHGAHPNYLTEWWYYTGNLQTDIGRRFGYQFTIFRRSITPPDLRMQRSSAWATDQVYLAHLAVTDVDDLDYHAFERFARGAAGLAGAGSPPYRVWLYDWQVMQVDDGAYRLSASEMGIKLDLTLMDSKGPILQGDEGYSRKSDGPGNASTYVSQTRLLTSGEISVNGENFQVSGTSWMDHEYSTNALSPGQIGWDWFAIQLDNQSELMVYNIRRSDGTRDPFSSGTFIDQSGSYSSLDGSDFSMTVLDTWESPHSKAVYPSKWQLHVKSLDLDLVVEPLLVDQELDLTYTYWEGAVTIEGEMAGAPITGVGYVELTGYAGAFAGEF